MSLINWKTFYAAAASAAVLALGCGAAPAAMAAPPTAMDFARMPAISNVILSRDGEHIAAITSPDGHTSTISIWKTSALDQPPFVIGAAKVKILAISFLKNDRLLVTTIQPFTVGSRKDHLYRTYISDLEGKSFKSLLPEARARSEYDEYLAKFNNAQLLSALPLDPEHVIVLDGRADTDGDIVKVNVYTGSTQRLDRASDKMGGVQVDLKGEIRAKQEIGYDNGAVYFAQWIKHPDTGQWEEHFRWFAKNREPTSILGFSPDRNIIYVSSTKGRDKAGIYEYDIRQKKILEPLFEHRLFEAGGVLSSTAPEDFGTILGFTYAGANSTIYWADPKLAALNKSVQAALKVKTVPVDWTDIETGAKAKFSVPDGFAGDVVSWSADRRFMIVDKSGPKNPSEYYLLNAAGELRLLGKSRPSINTAELGDTRLVQYKARDGLVIPAFLTTPPADKFGPGPYPTLIEPHGGPWSRDNLDFDSAGWVQYFASRGYAVLLPQFRGSEGWGQKLWRAGDGEWGQKMQDDKDDGVKWLIEQKIAAPDRVAMFGYSYGGYAALVAAIRPNGLYQCAISGAGAGDLATIKRATFENRFQREFQNPTIRGLDALDHAAEAQIPLFIYHGDRDQTVEVKQSRRFVDTLKAAGKPHRYWEIKDAGHQLVTMDTPMLEAQLVEIEKYLNTECGPGGL